MPWSTSDRRDRLPANWATLRIRALRRDGYRCQARDTLGRLCGAPANQVDHIAPSGADILDNLQSLCTWHHGQKSAAEGVAARRAKGYRSNRRPDSEPHPGLLP